MSNALADAGYESIAEAVAAEDQEGAVGEVEFVPALQAYLGSGRFRLVLVLDDVSSELERIIAYLDSVTLQTLTIDLITINVYDVNGVEIALPQRVSPDISANVGPSVPPTRTSVAPSSVLSDEPDAFVESLGHTTGQDREAFDQLVNWATRLA